MTGSRQLSEFLSLVTLGTALTTARPRTRPEPGAEWPYYAADAAATHYSPLDRITRQNVAGLKMLWEWPPGEVELPEYGTRQGAFQNTPPMIDGVLYVVTPYNEVAALDATTGQERWRFNAEPYRDRVGPDGLLAFGLQ